MIGREIFDVVMCCSSLNNRNHLLPHEQASWMMMHTIMKVTRRYARRRRARARAKPARGPSLVSILGTHLVATA